MINAQIQESISGIVVAKSFRQERAIYDTFAANNQQAYRRGPAARPDAQHDLPGHGHRLRPGHGRCWSMPGAGHAGRRHLARANWYLFMQAVGFFWWPMMSIASFWSQFQDGLSAAERVFALIDAEPKVVQTAARAGGAAGGAHRVPRPGLQLHRRPEQVLDGLFSLGHPARRDAWRWWGTPAPARAASPG